MRYFKVPYDIITRDDLSQGELMLLLQLMQKESEFNKEGKWFDIGFKDLNIKNHTYINKYRKSLKEKGLIDYKNGYSVDGKKSNSQYLIKIDRAEPPKEKQDKKETIQTENLNNKYDEYKKWRWQLNQQRAQQI